VARLESLTADLVGRRYPEFKFEITEGWLRDYKEALFFSPEEVADASFVPQSFIACLRDAEFHVFEALGISLSQLLHAAQKYEFVRDLRVSDHIVCRATLSSLKKKEGRAGAMAFLEITNEFYRELPSGGEELCIRTGMTVVVRQPAGVSP